jgi:uncharacterized protein YqjF (DUF2071 family)/uncharacterized protein with NAD-binding domain and iron-sulfur cluster
VTSVAILGGGVAGLTAAHELAERGFVVTLFERRDDPGGKARSEKATDLPHAGRKPLPGEHGFRFFPGFYKHVPDTMRRIPFAGNRNGVFDNLVPAPRGLFALSGEPPFQILMRLPRSLNDLETALQIPADLEARGMTAADYEFFMGRLLRVLTMCQARRYVELENIAWWDFVDASNRSRAYQLLLATGLTRNAVATQAHLANARTIADIAIQLMTNMATVGEVADRVLTGPTTEMWIEPWRRHLTDTLGVHLHTGATVAAINFADGAVTGVDIEENGVRSTFTADAYVCALPLNVAAELLPPALIAYDPSLQGLPALATQMSWMTGMQFYVDYEVSLVDGHINCIDSPWAVTALSQKQFWPEVNLQDYGDGTTRDIISVDISSWEQPADAGTGIPGAGKCAKDCTKDEIAAQVWHQLQQALNTPTPRLTTYTSYFLDDAIVPASSGPHLHDNLDPLLVNETGSWVLRPDAALHVRNLFLAGDYVRSSTDFASMEAANEAARRAVNALLSRTGFSGAAGPCSVWNLHEPDLFAPCRAADLERFVHGESWAAPSEWPGAVTHAMEHLGERILHTIEIVAEKTVELGERILHAGAGEKRYEEVSAEVAAIVARNTSAQYPPPREPWATYQVWRNLFFAHWPIGAKEIRRLVPPELDIDTFAGEAFVSMVAMEMSEIYLASLGAMPGGFPELNLRTYVRYQGVPGVYFLQIDSPQLAEDMGARLMFNVPYTLASMGSQESDDVIAFRSRRLTRPEEPEASYVVTFKPLGEPSVPEAGSRTAFLRNRDRAFVLLPHQEPATVGERRFAPMLMIHDPWQVQQVDPQSTRIVVNSVLAAAGLAVPQVPLAMDFTSEIASIGWLPASAQPV